MSVTWLQDETAWLGKVRSAAASGLTGYAKVVEATMKVKVSIPGPEPSSPGEPPHLQTGNLFRNIDHEPATPSDLVAGAGLVATSRQLEAQPGHWWVGEKPQSYGLKLEFGYPTEGGRYVAPRPWIISSLWESSRDGFGVFKGTFAREMA